MRYPGPGGVSQLRSLKKIMLAYSAIGGYTKGEPASSYGVPEVALPYVDVDGLGFESAVRETRRHLLAPSHRFPGGAARLAALTRRAFTPVPPPECWSIRRRSRVTCPDLRQPGRRPDT